MTFKINYINYILKNINIYYFKKTKNKYYNQSSFKIYMGDKNKAAEYEFYKRIKLLGEGAFGKAYLVECL